MRDITRYIKQLLFTTILYSLLILYNTRWS